MFIRQRSFAGGEISPILNGRDDLSRYLSSLAKCQNVIITRHGVATNRPGTRFVCEVKDSTKKVRLVPFNFGNDQNFVLEFGHNYIRFVKNGGQVVLAGVPMIYGYDVDGNPLYRTEWSSVTIYSVGDVQEYDGNVYVALQGGSNHNPGSSPTYWDLLGAVGAVVEVATSYTETELPYLRFAQIGDVVTICHQAHAPAELRRYSNYQWSITNVSTALLAHGVSGAHINYKTKLAVTGRKKAYNWGATTIWENAAGDQKESSLYVMGGNAETWDLDTAADWSGATTYAAGQVVIASSHKLYVSKVNNNLNNEPTVSPTYWALFKPNDGWDMSLTEHKPTLQLDLQDIAGYTAVAVRLFRGNGDTWGYVDELKVLRGTVPGTGLEVSPSAAITLDGSEEVDFNTPPPTGTNPFATDFPATVCFHDQRRVFANTPLRPSGVLASKVGEYNNFDRPAFVKDDSSIDIELAALGFEEIRWLVSLRGLLAGTNVAAPWVLTGAGGVRDVLSAVSLSARPQNMYGSSWLEPLLVGSALLVVQETGNRVREVLFDYSVDAYQSNEMSIMSEHLFSGHTIVDWSYAKAPDNIVWAVREDGILLGLTYSREQEVAAWHWHDTRGSFERVVTVQEGLEYAVYFVIQRTINGVIKRYIERAVSRVLPVLNGQIDVSRSVFLDCALTYDGPVPITVASGLGHLAGEEVMGLADGNVIGPFTVALDGKIDFSEEVPDGANVVTFGLSYTSRGKLLDAVAQGVDLKSKQKRVINVQFEVVETRGLKFGSDFDDLTEWRQRKVGHGYAAIPAFTGADALTISSTFDESGAAVWEQSDPLPFTILSVTREIDVSD